MIEFEFGFPLLTLMVIAPLVAAIAIGHVGGALGDRRLASVVTILVLITATAVSWQVKYRGGSVMVDPWAFAFVGEPRPLLGVDAFTGLLLPYYALLCAAVVTGLPRTMLPAGSLRAILLLESTTLAGYAALDLGLLAIVWIGGIATALATLGSSAGGRRLAGFVGIYLASGAIALVVAVTMVGRTAWVQGIRTPLHLPALTGGALGSTDEWVVALLLGAALARQGVLPLHSWMAALFERGSPALVSLLVTSNLGAFLLARVVVPLFPDVAQATLPLVATLAIAAALYGALLALVQTDLRRMLGFVATSQAAFELVGLQSEDPIGLAGGLTVWLSAGVAATGLWITTMAVEARTGQTSLIGFGGLSARTPLLAAGFLFFGLAAVGIPGTLGFVADDLLVHGVLEVHPVVGAGLVAATAANGWSMLHGFSRVFLGPPDRVPAVDDVLPRERLVVVVLAALLVGGGLWPHGVVDTRARAVDRILPADVRVPP